ncbi:DUF551 domain-containing protein [Acinetobacter sp. CFCC 10889]
MQRWISISERMPKFGCRVLVFNETTLRTVKNKKWRS